MPMQAPQAFLIFSGFNLRAIISFCRALDRDKRPFRIVACTSTDPIFQTAWRHAIAATRQQEALVTADVERCIKLAHTSTGIEAWCIAPSSEFFVRWCLDRREWLASFNCSLPLPDRPTYLQLSDKRPFTEFCRARGLSVPAGRPTLESIRLPCVAKPLVNVTPEGISIYPWLLRNQDDLAAFHATARPGDYFFQEWVEGESIYLLLHLDHDGHSVRFSQRNLAQQPGGKSIVLAEAARFHLTPVADELEDALKAVGFSGLIMVELRLRPSGEAVVIEANPRLWGPLQLVVDHCPAMLESYFTHYLGPRSHRSPQRRDRPKGSYLWLGGARQTGRTGRTLVWHVPVPKWPRWELLRRFASDVYLRPDTFLWFWRE